VSYHLLRQLVHVAHTLTCIYSLNNNIYHYHSAYIGQKIRQQGAKYLSKGMETLNQSEIGSALQVFYNLGNTELATQVHVIHPHHTIPVLLIT
jgi:hypothetical protein